MAKNSDFYQGRRQRRNYWLIPFVLLIGLIGFAATFTLYITNGENKLIYYVIRPFLNKHYDSQVRDRKI